MFMVKFSKEFRETSFSKISGKKSNKNRKAYRTGFAFFSGCNTKKKGSLKLNENWKVMSRSGNNISRNLCVNHLKIENSSFLSVSNQNKEEM